MLVIWCTHANVIVENKAIFVLYDFIQVFHLKLKGRMNIGILRLSAARKDTLWLGVYFSKSFICSQLYQMIYILSYRVIWQTNGKIFGSRCICACQNQLNTSNEIIMELFKIISAKHCRGDLSYRATNTCQKYAKTNNLLVLWYLKML